MKDYDKITRCIPLAAGDSMLSAYKKNLGSFLNSFDSTFNEVLIAKVYNQLNKIAISFGWVGGSVKQLSSSYNATDTYNPAPTDIVRDGFASSMFLSLGYAIFGK